MAETYERFDAADFLIDEEDIAIYLEEVSSENDPKAFAKALGTVARARNKSQLARETGMTRAGLAKALGDDANPSLATFMKVANALGFQLTLRPMAS